MTAPPPGPFRPAFWRSPLRGPWLTSALGSVLLVLVGTVAVTGFLSHAAYEPGLRGNATVHPALPLAFGWPTHPSWLYALTQGLHVNAGLAAIPFLLAKLWSVIPRLWTWPPVASAAQAIERGTVALLVAGAVFEIATGVVNAQYWYPFHFGFVEAHYYGAVVFVAALVAHLAIKLPIVRRAFRARGVVAPLRERLADTQPEPSDPHGGLAPVQPAAPTMSRRGLFAFAGAGSLVLLAANVGETIGGPLRETAFLAPRRAAPGGFPVNRTASTARVTREMAGRAWRLELRGGPEPRALSREELLALPQRTERLPIGCVEGWSTMQDWTGVRLAALALRAGVATPTGVHVVSLQPAGAWREASLSADQVRDPRALLALKVGGADLPLDHGYPARIIVPALPGVHNTKWVSSLEFAA